MPACSNSARTLSSLPYAIGRRREREQLPDRDCESTCGCHCTCTHKDASTCMLHPLNEKASEPPPNVGWHAGGGEGGGPEGGRREVQHRPPRAGPVQQGLKRQRQRTFRHPENNQKIRITPMCRCHPCHECGHTHSLPPHAPRRRARVSAGGSSRSSQPPQGSGSEKVQGTDVFFSK